MDNAYKYEEVLLSWPVTIGGTIAYLAAVLIGQRLMKNREKFALKGLMTLHNVVLFVWSVAMCAGGLYETITAVSNHPFLDVYCASKIRPGNDRIMTGKAWFWIWLFFASKFYEFLDTAFIVLRKSPLIFLHVYVRRKVARPRFPACPASSRPLCNLTALFTSMPIPYCPNLSWGAWLKRAKCLMHLLHGARTIRALSRLLSPPTHANFFPRHHYRLAYLCQTIRS